MVTIFSARFAPLLWIYLRPPKTFRRPSKIPLAKRVLAKHFSAFFKIQEPYVLLLSHRKAFVFGNNNGLTVFLAFSLCMKIML